MHFTKFKINLLLTSLTILAACPLFTNCKNEVLPKPKGQLRLQFEQPTYKEYKTQCGFSFQKNTNAHIKKNNKNKQCGYIISYKNLNATIYLTHRTITNDLKKLLKDAQNLTQEHVVKADEIISKEYENKEKKVYGMFYEVLGNAASQSQFYLTDSTQHFLLGSVYFNVKPNYDSIYPSAKYLQKDMEKLMESTKWQ